MIRSVSRKKISRQQLDGKIYISVHFKLKMSNICCCQLLKFKVYILFLSFMIVNE